MDTYGEALDFQDLFGEEQSFLAGMMPLGVSDNGDPFVIDLLAPEVHHLLVTGDAGTGKTVLLRTAAISLALLTGQPWIQLAIISGGNSEQDTGSRFSLDELRNLPHSLWPVARGEEEAAELLHFLVQETTYRIENQIVLPRIVLFVDELALLLSLGGEAVAEPLRTLLAKQEAGSPHLFLATRNPLQARASLPLDMITTRLLGPIDDKESVRAAAGRPLDEDVPFGQGEFLAVRNEKRRRFRAALADRATVELTVASLCAPDRPALIARPLPAHGAPMQSLGVTVGGVESS